MALALGFAVALDERNELLGQVRQIGQGAVDYLALACLLLGRAPGWARQRNTLALHQEDGAVGLVSPTCLVTLDEHN